MRVVDYIKRDAGEESVEINSQALWEAMTQEDRDAHDRGEAVDFKKYLDADNRLLAKDGE